MADNSMTPLAVPKRNCARLRGVSARRCWCRLPNEGGWAPCPPEAQGVMTPPAPATVEWVEPPTASPHELSRLARAGGYTGNECDHCGSMRMRQNGTCEVCDDCGESGACG